MSDKKKKPVIKWLLIGVVVIVVFISFNYLKAQKTHSLKIEAMEEQRQALTKNWEEQGFTDEEIEEKLESMRPARSDDDHWPGAGAGVMRMMTGGRGQGGK
jgi:hypothetical protein